MQRSGSILDWAGLATVSTLVIYGIALSWIVPEAFERVHAAEDGWIEWLTVGALLAGAGLCLVRMVRLRRSRSPQFLAVTLLLGLAFLFGVGEEISWGQRAFAFSSPEFFRAHNTQQELNVHNLELGNIRLNRVIFSNGIGIVAVIYLLGLLPMYHQFPRVAHRVDSLGIPVFRIRHGIFGLILAIVIQFASDSPKRWELLEFGLSAVVVLGMWRPQNAPTFDPATPAPKRKP